MFSMHQGEKYSVPPSHRPPFFLPQPDPIQPSAYAQRLQLLLLSPLGRLIAAGNFSSGSWERACSGAPRESSSSVGHLKKRRSLECRRGTPEEEERGGSVQSHCTEQGSMSIFVFCLFYFLIECIQLF